MNKDQVATIQDLMDMEARLIIKLGEIKDEERKELPRLIKSRELRKVLGGVSEGWLQSARIHGMPFTKIQGLILYPLQEVLDYLKSHKRITHETH